MSAVSKPDDDQDNLVVQFVNLFQAMHDMHDKLLLLDYRKQFVAQYKCPPINRYYFCKQQPNNQAQQFFTFCCLSSFLINKLSGKNDFTVDSFDDPNLTIDRILNAAQAYIDITPYVNVRGKFKQAFGIELIGFLGKLVDKLCLQTFAPDSSSDSSSASSNIESVRVKFFGPDGLPIDEDDEDVDDDYVDDAEDQNEIELEEEFADYIIDEDDVDGAHFEEDANAADWQNGTDDDLAKSNEAQKSIITADHIDLTEWKLELERVLPQLNARQLGQSLYRSGTYENEWRLHYKAAIGQNRNIATVYGDASNAIDRLRNDIGQSLEKIDAKEKYLRQNLSTILAEWSTVRERATAQRTAYDAAHQETNDKAARLTQLAEEDRATKQAIEEYSLKITDSSPLIDAKRAREALKKELINVNLQIGVAIQTLVRHVSLHTSSVY